MIKSETTGPELGNPIEQTSSPNSVPEQSKTSAQLTDAQSPVKNTLHISKPLGHVNTAAWVCGLAGAVVAVVLDLIHLFDSVLNSVKATYASKPFYLEDMETWHQAWDWGLAFILGWAVAYVVLDTLGKGKRVFIGIVALVLLAMFSPLLMLWGVLWIPVAEIVAVSFALICSLIYTSQHVMPCELGTRMKKVKPKKTISKTKRAISHSEPTGAENSSANIVENPTDAST